ncbi:CapA family protein [Deltaproteobacteria bacterium OttesenSCG-928-M10]|nr:CapA family protein [Deltaproteobacteria bacterium OttesenSCG-928-M10]
MKKSTMGALTAWLLALAIWTAGAAEAAPKTIRIAAMGDIMLGPEASADVFAAVKPYLADRQVVIGNLEGPLTDRGAPTKEVEPGVSYVFRTPPALADRFSEAGFTVMNLANNHVNDYGPAGAQQTREVLEKAGILYTGAPGEVARQKVGKTTVAVIGLAPNSGCQDLNDIPAAAELVRQEAAKPNTVVIVTFHGGGEGPGYIYVPSGPESYLGESRGDLRRLGRAMIDAGAHLVIGHGPHVPRGLEIYQDRLIAYSLGNFTTGSGLSVSGRNGLAPLLLVDLTVKGKLAGGQIVSFKQEGAGQTGLDQSGEAGQLMHTLSLLDFDSPALDPEGKILTTDSAARTMAAALPKPDRPKAVMMARAAKPEPAAASADTEARADETGQKARNKRKALARSEDASSRYEWARAPVSAGDRRAGR